MFILLSGKDEFSANEELTRLRASDDFGYNQDTFAGEGADLAAIRNACDTMPFLAEKRLVVVEGLPKPRKRKGSAEDGDDEDGRGRGRGQRLPEPPVATPREASGERRPRRRDSPRWHSQKG